ncbi:MAG: chemotaxis response regulator protein-glutamate methylesterase [Candidatus Peribacteria bacterium]|nr:chemotaxis response regulator protein-glutamate methylesterase [Candidatus Peribacteria bacterium]
MITVLIADDSFLMRKVIGDILSSDPDIRVVGSVSDGEQVIAEAKRLQPDVITMDLEMPKLNGLEATRHLMHGSDSRPIVLMVSAFGRDQAEMMLECLHAGAFDCVTKPSGPLSLDLEKVKKEMIAKVKAAASSRRDALKRNRPLREPVQTVSVRPGSGECPLVLMGASTGGPPILEEFFADLVSPLPAAVLVVQHMPEHFTATMADRIDRISCMKVKEAQDGERLKPGLALVAPGNFHMRVVLEMEDDRQIPVVRLSQTEPIHGMRPSIDALMTSASRVYKGPIVGVLLTGMGEDGAEGMAAIHNCGGTTIVQDPQTCVVDSMVQAALRQTTVDSIVTPDELAHGVASAVSLF